MVINGTLKFLVFYSYVLKHYDFCESVAQCFIILLQQYLCSSRVAYEKKTNDYCFLSGSCFSRNIHKTIARISIQETQICWCLRRKIINRVRERRFTHIRDRIDDHTHSRGEVVLRKKGLRSRLDRKVCNKNCRKNRIIKLSTYIQLKKGSKLLWLRKKEKRPIGNHWIQQTNKKKSSNVDWLFKETKARM